MKRLYRSTDNRVLTGLLGGVGDYTDTDPVLIRVIFIFAMFVTGFIPGAVAYVIASLITPLKPVHVHEA